MVKCILCNKDFEKLTSEHIVEDSLGGILKIDCLCRKCNSGLGLKVDSLITNSKLLLLNRYKYNIRGKTNKFSRIGDAKVVNGNGVDTGLKAQLMVEDKKWKVINKLIEKDKESFIVIANNKEEMKNMAEKKVGRLNDGSKLDYKSLDNLDEISLALKDISMTIDVNKELEMLILPLLKIAFEMSFLIYGDKYLDDEIAEEYRKTLYSVARENADSYSINKNWFKLAFIKGELKSETHLKFYEEDGKLFFEIILFNIFAKFFISNNPTGLKAIKESKEYLSSINNLGYFFINEL